MRSEGAPEDEVRRLYEELLGSWNRRDAGGYAGLFAEDGNAVGFDGSQMNGTSEIESSLSQVFAHHQTASYVWKVREIRSLGPQVAVLRAAAGMASPGTSELNPAANAVQTLVAARRDGQWRIAVFQNTPAAFHGRPEASEALTEELQGVLRAKGR